MGTSNMFGTSRPKLVFSLPVKVDSPPSPTLMELSTKQKRVSLRGRHPAVLTPTPDVSPVPLEEEKAVEAVEAVEPIKVTSNPPASRIYLDGNAHGLAPTSVSVPVGDIAHIRVSHKGYKSMNLEGKAGDVLHAELVPYSKSAKVNK